MLNLGKPFPWFFIGSIIFAQSLVLVATEKSAFLDQHLEHIGSGQLLGPEDVAYDSKSKLIYTGCSDGWIKRVTVNPSASETAVENWVNTRGRPLGIAFGRQNDVIVADAVKGLLSISQRRKVKILTVGNKYERFKLIDSVVVAKNGVIYFTEASHKYSLNEYMLDILEGQPHGRLWSYDPTSNRTTVLLTGLYFCNGLALSPGQDFVIFCETARKRCRKFYTQGDKKGSVVDFIDLPGYPDNIRYAGEGNFMIALVMPSLKRPPDSAQHTTTYVSQRHVDQDDETGVVFVVNNKGKIRARYTGTRMSLITSASRVGNYIYCGSLVNPWILRLNLQNNSSSSQLEW